MKLKKIILITLLLLAVLTITSVSAVDNLTDEGILQENPSEEIELSEDVNDELVSSSQDEIISATDDGTFTALQNKINSAQGATITLENDYTYDEGFDTTGIEISKPLTINGNGHTINALSKSRIFKITYENDGNVVLNNIKFNNGYTDEEGGAIYVKPDYYFAGLYTVISLEINNCVFTNNHADYGGAIHAYRLTGDGSTFNYNSAYTGGSIYIKDTSTFTNCKFNNNNASYEGGAIFMNSNDGDRSWTASNCIFNSNYAPNGGAIYSQEELTVSASTFSSNEAGIGGALVSSSSPLCVLNSNFNKNHASKNGGAIYFSGLTTITSNGNKKVVVYNNLIQDSTFEDNVADEDGGAIYSNMEYNGKSYGMNITKCTFINNKGSSDSGVVGSIPKNCEFKTSSSSSQSSSSSSSSTTTKITKTTPKLTASSKTFKVKTKTKKYTATLKTNKNKPMKKVKLHLKVKGKTYTAKTNSKGKATFKIKNLKKKGTYKATVTFKGNNNYKKVSITVKIKIK